MVEFLRQSVLWVTTSGIKILGIVVCLAVLAQMSRWIVRWIEKFVPERDPLRAAEAKKRAQTLGTILRHALESWTVAG
jgi:hypothetical protein